MMKAKRDYDSLVRQSELVAQENPRLYRLLVGWLAVVGYAYIAGLFILALASLIALVVGVGFLIVNSRSISADMAAVKIAIPITIALFGFCSAIARSLFLKLPDLQGPELRPEVAPRLFQMLDEVSLALKAPRFHRVFITDDFNAGVIQRPRWGFFGSINHLVIGFPLMKATSPEHFRAIIAHELGHISGNHSQFGGWIYRQRTMWRTVYGHIGHSPLIVPFLKWYIPYFSAYTFALARLNEYTSDQCSAELAGSQRTAEALIAIEVYGRYLATVFWPGILARADLEPAPGVQPYTILFDDTTSPAGEQATSFLIKSLCQESDTDDPHPSLRERLNALGYKVASVPNQGLLTPQIAIPLSSKPSAAQALLGTMAVRLAAEMDRHWTTAIASAWRKSNEEAQAARQRLDSLDRSRTTQRLNVNEELERANLVQRLYGETAGIPIMREACAAFPQDPRPNAVLGLSLLDAGDELGVQYLEASARLDPKLRTTIQSRIAEFRRESALQGLLTTAARAKSDNNLERSRVQPGDRWIPHGVPARVLRDTQDSLAQFTGIKQAFLVRKIVRVDPTRPLFVLVLVPTGQGIAESQMIASGLKLPGDVKVVILDTETKWLLSAISALPGAQIYRGSVDQSA